MYIFSQFFNYFSLTKVLQSDSKYVLLLRGKYFNQNVVLKCHLVHTFGEDVWHFAKQSASMYEIEMYRHAVSKLSRDFFSQHIGTTIKKWQFKDLQAISSETLGPAEALILNWCKTFPFESIEDFNDGVRILISVDAGQNSVYQHLSGKTNEIELANFVIQTTVALNQMSEAHVVHGDLRWANIMYPVSDACRYFDVKHQTFCQTIVNEHCVPMANTIKILDWDNGFSSDVPDETQRLVFQTYHVSETTNMNGIYDKLGFLRLLHLYFPYVYLDDDDLYSLEPAFTSYVYFCPVQRKLLYQISEKPGRSKYTWPDIKRLEDAINKVLQQVYTQAVDVALRRRRSFTRDTFCLAVEGDNMEVIRDAFRFPHFLDLDGRCFLQLALAATARYRNNVEPHFYGGVVFVLTGETAVGLEMMGISADSQEQHSLRMFVKKCVSGTDAFSTVLL